MGRFNLLDEPWIRVMTVDSGEMKEVSLLEVFQHADKYIDLAGEMKTQDFAVLRTMLAVLHTVFSRFDADGRAYEWIELDEKYRQMADVEEDDIDDYAVALMKTWEKLWGEKKFPSIVAEYLEKWRDRFYLLDDKHPFYQVRKEDIAPEQLKSKTTGKVWGKNFNRTVSESANKESLFSPKGNVEKKDNKNILSPAEITRWLIMFHGYTGTADKTKFRLCPEQATLSKGWLYDIGGMYCCGSNLLETLLLNLVLVPELLGYVGTVQKPAWETDSSTQINEYFSLRPIDNIAALYTRWSRAIYIDPETDCAKPFYCELVKLPEVDHSNQFLEPMTLWSFNEKGDYKDTFTPRKHRVNQSLWRSFGLLSSREAKPDQRKAGIYSWLQRIEPIIGNYQICLMAIGMESDNNATSWVPVNEIVDNLDIHDAILLDADDAGWVIRIEEVVTVTKEVVEKTFGSFIRKVLDVQNIAEPGRRRTLTDYYQEQLYFLIDSPFKDWLMILRPGDDKEKRIAQWYTELHKIVRRQAEEILRTAGPREYKGKVANDKFENIMTAYNSFSYFLNQKLPTKEGHKHAK